MPSRIWDSGRVNEIRSVNVTSSRCVAGGRAFNGVRARRKNGERKLEAALEALTGALDASGATWMLIGGIAVIARGVRRLTTDIDVAVRGDDLSVDELLRVFSKRKIKPRIE